MKGTNVSTTVRAGVLALSLLLLPITMPTSAQTTNPTPETQRMEMHDDDGDNTGLWGLLGWQASLGSQVSGGALGRPAPMTRATRAGPNQYRLPREGSAHPTDIHGD